jgi:uncharacterized protein (TIGR00369 family)
VAQTTAVGPFRRRPDLAELNGMAVGTAIDRLGIAFTELGEDFLRGTMPVDARTLQPFGLLHGGASVLLAESLASMAANLCLEDPAKGQAVGIEINANHLRAMTQGQVTGTARPIHVGRGTQVWDIRIEDEQGRAVCVSRLTLAMREPR